MARAPEGLGLWEHICVDGDDAVFPLDTLKTRWQTGQPAPSFGQMYFGYLPAITYSAFGMGLWVCCRNFLERQIPDPGSHRGALRYWKHLLTGALAGVFVQLPTFPFDTVKKRMQASENPGTLMSEARLLLDAGGPGRFYRGFTLKCGFVALNGALFNAVYGGAAAHAHARVTARRPDVGALGHLRVRVGA